MSLYRSVRLPVGQSVSRAVASHHYHQYLHERPRRPWRRDLCRRGQPGLNKTLGTTHSPYFVVCSLHSLGPLWWRVGSVTLARRESLVSSTRDEVTPKKSSFSGMLHVGGPVGVCLAARMLVGMPVSCVFCLLN